MHEMKRKEWRREVRAVASGLHGGAAPALRAALPAVLPPMHAYACAAALLFTGLNKGDGYLTAGELLAQQAAREAGGDLDWAEERGGWPDGAPPAAAATAAAAAAAAAAEDAPGPSQQRWRGGPQQPAPEPAGPADAGAACPEGLEQQQQRVQQVQQAQQPQGERAAEEGQPPAPKRQRLEGSHRQQVEQEAEDIDLTGD